MTQLELSTFLTIAKYGSISAAAGQLFVSQPALSRRIRSLEIELGYSLFDRQQGKKGLQLTPEGKEFIWIAEQWLDVWKNAITLKEKSVAPEFTVILNSSMGVHVPIALNEFIKFNRYIKFKFHVYHSLEAYQWIEYGRADFALVSKLVPSSVIHAIPAYTEKMYLVSKNMYSSNDSLSPRQLDISNELLVPWCPAFQDWHDYWFGSAASPKVFGDNSSLMQHFWLNENRWWSIIPASFLDLIKKVEGVKISLLSDAPSDLVIYYLVKSSGKSPFTDDFLSCIVNKATEIDGIQSCIGN